MYTTLIMFAMTFWTWGQFFKWTGLIYGVYYTILISYEVWKSYKKGSNTEGVEMIYEVPQFGTLGSTQTVDIKPKKVTLLDMQTKADELVESEKLDKLDKMNGSDNIEKENNLNKEQNYEREVLQEPRELNQAIVEEHSLNTTQFVQKHRANIGKALNAFS